MYFFLSFFKHGKHINSNVNVSLGSFKNKRFLTNSITHPHTAPLSTLLSSSPFNFLFRLVVGVTPKDAHRKITR